MFLLYCRATAHIKLLDTTKEGPACRKQSYLSHIYTCLENSSSILYWLNKLSLNFVYWLVLFFIFVLHQCYSPSYVACRDFTRTSRTPTWLYHSPIYVSCRHFTCMSRTPTWLYHFTKIEDFSLKKNYFIQATFYIILLKLEKMSGHVYVCSGYRF